MTGETVTDTITEATNAASEVQSLTDQLRQEWQRLELESSEAYRVMAATPEGAAWMDAVQAKDAAWIEYRRAQLQQERAA